MDDKEIEELRAARRVNKGVALGEEPAGFDGDLYSTARDKESYVVELDDDDEDAATGEHHLAHPQHDAAPRRPAQSLAASYSAPKEFMEETIRSNTDQGELPDPFDQHKKARTIAERENEYKTKGREARRVLSPDRNATDRTYADVMNDELRNRAESKELTKDETDRQAMPPPPPPPQQQLSIASTKKRRRWDVSEPSVVTESDQIVSNQNAEESEVTKEEQPRRRRRWDVPATPVTSEEQSTADTGTASRRSRWDEAPVEPPVPHQPLPPMTPEAYALLRHQHQLDEKNRPLTDEELDEMLPSEGYTILQPPVDYVRRPAQPVAPTGPALQGPTLYAMPAEGAVRKDALGMPEPAGDLEGIVMKPDDYQNFAKILTADPDEGNDQSAPKLSAEEIKERKIMRLLLKIKNGTPPMRKVALRHITDRAREFGAGPLFNQILPLLMSPTLEDGERHLLVKVIDRILYKLDDLVRPYVHKILVVIEPLLIDEDYYARVEGREIISNLAKAAGLATMIFSMRPDIDAQDPYVRDTTARAFAVVASALGIPSMLPFLKAVCRHKKSWYARHTGTKIVQQIAIHMGCAVLPHLRSLVEIIEGGLGDEQGKVRTMCALAIAALAEASAPYGIESFDSVLQPLWTGIREHRSTTLAAFLKAIGFIIPLMDTEFAAHYTRAVMIILIREFQTPDEDMKKIVLKVVKQCVVCEGVEPEYVRKEVLPEYFRCFWVRRMALDRRNYRQLVETTEELAAKLGGGEIVGRLVEDLKDDAEPYRRMVAETIGNVIKDLGVADVSDRLEERLIDCFLTAFQEQGSDENPVVLTSLGILVTKLGLRSKKYLQQIGGIIKWRLNNKSARIRQQAADLAAQIAPVMRLCDEEELMSHLGLVLFEYLGEEYPDVLGSILGGLKGIVSVIGIAKMSPPIQDLLPRLTPILKNRHEKVQENCIDLVGRIADRGAEYISSREWMRICFELLDLLKAPRKAIRRAAVSTFGYIAKAIGPQDVLATLLNNLKVQERQQRVCTTVAIAIVAETCQPFTVLPVVMNEYKIPDLNVQNGVLKSLSFLFEYVGEMGKDYIYAVTPLLEDALIDRDLVHRQTACSTVGHIALGVYGLGCEEALIHLLNHVWPNVFEKSPHVINAVLFAINGCMVSLGPTTLLLYVVQGLFHPARKVRDVYWKIYNSLYVYSQDGLVPAYPRIADDQVADKDHGRYVREELDVVL